MTTTQKFLTAATLVAALASTACSSSTDTGNNGGTGGTSCSIVLTGAVTGTSSCPTAVGAYAPSANASAISLGATADSIAIAPGFTGQLHTGTFQSTDAGSYGAITLNRNGKAWLALGSTAGAATGSFTVNLTTVTTLSTTASGTAYLIHGTINATLAPVGTAGAPVTLKATF